jgi:hypothetical protein
VSSAASRQAAGFRPEEAAAVDGGSTIKSVKSVCAVKISTLHRSTKRTNERVAFPQSKSL